MERIRGCWISLQCIELFEVGSRAVCVFSSFSICLIVVAINYFYGCRMYHALLASGDHRSANIMLKKIPKDDAEVCYVIKACQDTYGDHTPVGKKKKKGGKKKEKRES